jgi:osmotically inducible protein OsmC
VGLRSPRIDLVTNASVPGIDAATFQKVATEAKENCPVSKALKAIEITLSASLE